MSGKPTNPIRRFLKKYQIVESGCWEWQAGCNPVSGYSSFWDGTRTVGGHQFSYVTFRGPVPEGMEIDHTCRNRKCVNPDHLEAVDRIEHNRRSRRDNPWWKELREHCVRGHSLKDGNVRMEGGTRVCRLCERIRSAEYRARQPESERTGPGRGSQWTAKTHCPQGHEYSDENTFVNNKGSRVCRTCRRESDRKRMARKRAIDPTYGRRKE